MGYSYSHILQNIKLVSSPVGQVPPVSCDQVHRDDHPGGREVHVREVDEHLGTPVDKEEPETKVFHKFPFILCHHCSPQASWHSSLIK